MLSSRHRRALRLTSHFLVPYRWQAFGALLALIVTAGITLSMGQGIKVLAHGAGAQGRIAPVDRLITRYTALPAGIRLDDAGVHGKAFALDQAGAHATTQHFIEQPAKQIAVPKTSVSIFGKGRVIGDFIFKAQPAEPAIHQVQMGLFAQPTL